MKMHLQKHHRFAALALAAALALQLSGCSWQFMPGPVISTEADLSREESSRTETGASSESRTETAPEAGTSKAAPESSGAPVYESSPAETDSPAGESSSAETVPDATESVPPETDEAPASFSVDYFRTPELLRAIASDAVFADAYNVISACIAYKTSARVSCAKEDAGRVIYLADTLCPLLKAFTDISEESFADGEMRWSFYVDKVEFAILRAEFEAQVAEYFEPVFAAGPDLSETERALLLYHTFTEQASYNYEIISGAFKTRSEAEKHRIHSAYAGIVDHTGVCHDLAGAMTFLFIQGGFDACRVTVIKEKEEHSWTLIRLDGNYTFCDATWDSGGSFSFFGNSAYERAIKAGGSYQPEDINIYDFNAPSHFEIVNPGFTDVQTFSRRMGNGTCLFFSIDTGVHPHRLIFRGPTNALLEIDVP